jgi:uncharacterized membrane protein (DUF2068 family)
MRSPAAASRHAIRAVAFVEACKGIVVLLVATGALSLVHQDLHALAARLVEHAHLNPAARYPRIFIEAAGQLQNGRLVMLALGAAGYSLVRFAEAYGLFHDKAWAEMLAAVSGAIYVPIELIDFIRHPGALVLGVFVVNVVIVAIMARALVQRRERRTTVT